MVTDDERRLVAERLRGEVGGGSSWPGIERLGLILGVEREPRTGWEGRILTRLADLIDPGESGQNLDKNRDTVQKESPAVQKAPECDREALLALAEELSGNILVVPAVYGTYQSGYVAACQDIARRIREACGEEGA